MEERYTKAFREVYIILNKSSKEELNKIPKSFVDFIEKNMDLNYKPQIDFNENFENSVHEETLLILALIYRDYLISKEERERLIQNEEKRLKELEQSYSVEQLFKKRKQELKEINENVEDIKMAYCEVDIILGQMEEKYVNKVPIELRKIFREQKRNDYLPEISAEKPLTEQKLMRKTIVILAMLNLNYWCEDEKVKQELIKIYAENDKKREEVVREKYNPDNLFKKNDIEITETAENTGCKEVIKYKKENFLKRILKKIKNLFKKQE